MPGQTFRVASFNAENLFSRARVLNMGDNTVADKIIKEIGSADVSALAGDIITIRPSGVDRPRTSPGRLFSCPSSPLPVSCRRAVDISDLSMRSRSSVRRAPMSFLRKIALTASHAMPPKSRSRLKWGLSIPDMEASCRNMKRLGFCPQTVIDVGAYVGAWTRMCKRIFPNARVLMCEPLPDKAGVLGKTVSELSDVRYEPVLLGELPEERIAFHVFESGSSMYDFRQARAAQTIELPVTTLDAVVSGTPFASPDLIKVDVQGAELDVLKGGANAMADAEVIILEVSLIDEYHGAPLFHEVQQYMAVNGFHAYDICTIWRNTPTASMNQADVIFARRDSGLFDRKHYNR